MGYRRHPFAPGEWYHCYTRGLDKRIVFEDKEDYARFIELLYLCNDDASLRRDNLRYTPRADRFEIPRLNPLVSVGTYCLMPNHFHLLLQEKAEGGIVRYMQKLGTAYTMYFNIKQQRVGALFVGPFRSRRVGSDRYFRRVAQYIHLNPIELFEKGWKRGLARPRLARIEEKLRVYPYSSLVDYAAPSKRPEKNILDKEALSLIRSGLPPLRDVLADAAAYYEQLERPPKSST